MSIGGERSRPSRPVYREHAPHAALARHVECYWTITGRVPVEEPLETAVLPDGCMDILFVLGDPPASPRGSGAAPYVVGTMTRPLEVAQAGDVRLLGVRFRPAGALPYLRAPASELTDGSTSLEALWSSGAAEAGERLALAGDDTARVGLLDGLLLGRLDRGGGHPDERVLRAAEAIAASGGAASVDTLAEAAGLGPRQLERRFLDAVGIPPKVACRIARFRRAAGSLQAGSAASLARVALESGYADQAHLTREFKALSGVTPGAYRRTRSHVTA